MKAKTDRRSCTVAPGRAETNGPAIHCSHSAVWPLAKLVEHPKNPNRHPEPQLKLLGKVIAANGWRLPVVVSKRSGFVVKGNGRIQAARLAGFTSVPVDVQEYASEVDELADLIADNRLAELAEMDEAELAKLLAALKEQDFDLELTGFDADSLDAALAKGLAESDVDAEPQIDKADELRKKWKVKPGQIWQLGEHRLMCGDSTNGEDVSKIAQPNDCSLCVTDPPYGVSYSAKNTFLNSIDKGNRVQKPIVNDHQTKEKTQEIWKAAFREMANVLRGGAVIYCFMPQGGDQMMMMMMMMMGAGIEPRHELIWLKNNHVLGRVDYAYKHEPILYAWKDGGHKFYGDFQTSILECDRPQKADMHPTMKPVDLIERLVRNSSKAAESIYEPFSGSGTTIIACERLGRKCRAMEIDPGYVAVAIQRWADATGKTPKLMP